MKNFHRSAVSALAISAAMLSGCAGATRLPARERGPAGEVLQTKQLDLAFLDAPGTQRQEVLDRLSFVDTAYSNPRLFWARWSESKWGYWWVIAGMNGAGAADAKRIWHIRNLLVSFDENGTVRKKALVGEDKSLWAELHSQLADAPPLDLSQPIQNTDDRQQGANDNSEKRFDSVRSPKCTVTGSGFSASGRPDQPPFSASDLPHQPRPRRHLG